jgi:hypothetical protein
VTNKADVAKETYEAKANEADTDPDEADAKADEADKAIVAG